MLGTRFWVHGQGSGYWVLSAGYQILGSGTGFSVLGSQFWVLGSGFRDWVLSAGY